MSRAPPLAEVCEPTHELFGLKPRVWGTREEALAGGDLPGRRRTAPSAVLLLVTLAGACLRPPRHNPIDLTTRPVNPARTTNNPNRGGDERRSFVTTFMLAFHRPHPLLPADISHLVVHVTHGPQYARDDDLKGGAAKVRRGRRRVRIVRTFRFAFPSLDALQHPLVPRNPPCAHRSLH
ncbi:hypothetical protein GALMADRAFT_1221845 [Galerina marginata CBS 339.88]|uniref:Uncharacterized protein n=1 Tax=Galerina marginata (strain CBS 339.88) TaxID=685588 RepID=A0A067S4I3_GALM3|nr:hypothetical protein GALMADRAFT_1221845 [Galerina marginata CBS 339.88]